MVKDAEANDLQSPTAAAISVTTVTTVTTGSL